MLNNWLEGKQLSNFRVDEFIGRGGMALVYKGWDLTLDRPVAIKIIAAAFQDDPAYTARFLQEGRSMARWRHENIVHVYYAGQEENLNYLVMEYIEGIDLKGWLAQKKKNNQKIPNEEILHIGRAIAAALDYAHTHHIVHRDVKPSNILMADDGRILLTDFGLALDLQEGSSGEAFGSPKYLSPEQAQGSKEIGPQSDLYSLGLILYEMLVGSPPFDGGSSTSLAVQHATQAPPLPSVLNPEINEATEKVLLKSLYKSPANRFQDGRSLLQALETALNTASEVAGPRTFSTKPVADVVVAHVASPQQSKIENPDESLAESSEPPVAGRDIKKILPFAAIGLAVISLCIGVIFITALILSRNGQDNIKLDGTSTGVAVNTSAENGGTSGNNPEAGQIEGPAPTVTLPGGSGSSEEKLIFMYNGGGFYAFNPGNRDILIREFLFQAVDADGNPTGTFFESRRWAGYYPAIQAGKCNRLEILNDFPKERPGQCNGYNAIMTPEDDDPMIFWLAEDNATQFTVSMAGQEIGRCEIGAGQCEVFLP